MATVAGLLCRFFDGGVNEILKPNMRACAHTHACLCVCVCTMYNSLFAHTFKVYL